jgi:hypothetical protein
MLFCYIYHFFVIPKYLTDMCSLCADVPGAAPVVVGGPAVVGDLPSGEAERVLIRVEQNFIVLTRMVLMAEIEDLPPSMQSHVVGAPQTWIRLFRCLANTVDQYNRTHRP